ncbi:hypothetical protein OG257_36685 [Streptomyces sp. NBC_00683]|uniref:hypothetical protein n=1 Tax=Streptomyces sp. NBC_00683 TaxID=2903670 RepID=UPI002E325359|nr:hypothetical protein [Streptomyces sp. NBC_00683]
MPSSDKAGREGRDPDAEIVVPEGDGPDEGPSDVFLDVPALHVDKLDLEVDDLEAHVSLQAEVLDLLKLNVGADVRLGRVQLGIEGVDVQAQLKVRLHHIAAVVTRLLATVDRNPQILEQLTRGVGAAVEDVGAGTGRAAGELGKGAGAAVSEVGRGAGTAVESVGGGAGRAVEGVGAGAGDAVEDVGRSAADAVEEAGEGAGGAVAGSTRDEGEQDDAGEESERPAARRRRRVPEHASTEPDRPRRTAPAKRASRGRKAATESPTPERRTGPAKKAAAKKTSAAKTPAKKASGRPRHRT